jgi:hypothetical protein
MGGAIPPLPQYFFMVWYLVEHRDNFTFTFTPSNDEIHSVKQMEARRKKTAVIIHEKYSTI